MGVHPFTFEKITSDPALYVHRMSKILKKLASASSALGFAQMSFKSATSDSSTSKVFEIEQLIIYQKFQTGPILTDELGNCVIFGKVCNIQ